MKHILICTTSLLTDRMILYNEFLSVLAKETKVTIWASSWDNQAFKQLMRENVTVEAFPKLKDQAYKNQLARRVLDYAWDHRKLSKSRKVLWEETRVGRVANYHHLLKALGKGVSFFGHPIWLEKKMERVLSNEVRSLDMEKRLEELNPDMVLITSPFRQDEPAIAGAAKKLKIPMGAFITTYDNITTKNRIVFDYDSYFVWSENMKSQLYKLYPLSKNRPVYIVGAPQFDVFTNIEYKISKENFCTSIGLDPNKPIIVYALGSPNLFDELPGAVEFLKRANKGEMGEIQVIIRPHPLFLRDPKLDTLTNLYPLTYLQLSTSKVNTNDTQDINKIVEWVNTFEHSDVIVQLASTVAIDGAFLDKPIINLDFDPSGKRQSLVKRVNHEMEHFDILNKMKAFWMAENYDEMVNGVNAYVKDPSKHKSQRKEAVEFVCGFTDGRCGKRFAEALVKQLSS